MKTDQLENKFKEMTENQIQVAEFLKAFDPILEPFESLAKHGISLAIFCRSDRNFYNCIQILNFNGKRRPASPIF